MKNKSSWGVLLIIILLVVGYFGQRYSKDVGIKSYTRFNNSEIQGTISYLGVRYRGAAFKIENDSTLYIFYPITDNKLNSGHIFDNFAKVGDSIVKHAFGNTLYLIKNGKKFNYKFVIPDH